MNMTQVWSNIIAYAVQIGLVVGIGATLPALLRLKAPRARLLFWQLLLIACLALPWVRPWRSEVITISNAQVAATQVVARMTTTAPAPFAMPSLTVIVLWLLVAGVAVRLVWLALGLLKLARYRRH